MLVIHAPEGLVHPMLVALLSRAVPDDAQGQLQGGLSSVMNVAMLTGTLFYSQLFGYFMRPDAPFVTPVISFYVAAALLLIALAMFTVVERGHRAGMPVPD